MRGYAVRLSSPLAIRASLSLVNAGRQLGAKIDLKAMNVALIISGMVLQPTVRK